MRSIMVLNSKGGSGKSTVATSIASYYATQGNKVMLVDLDPQASSLEWNGSKQDPADAAQLPALMDPAATSGFLEVPTMSYMTHQPRSTADS